MKYLLTILAAFMLSAETKAGNEAGGGGGTICDSRGCMTLAEAGIKISKEIPSSAYYNLSPELIDEITYVISNLPIPKNKADYWISSVIGGNKTFIIGNPDNDKRLRKYIKKYKKDYENILYVNGHNIQNLNFDLAAISVRDEKYFTGTILLESFFKLGSFNPQTQYEKKKQLRSQALMLIHESRIRKMSYNSNSVIPLDKILKLDKLIYEYISAVDTKSQDTIEFWPLISLLNDFNLISDYQVKWLFLNNLIESSGGFLKVSEICDETPDTNRLNRFGGHDRSIRCTITRAMGLKLNALNKYSSLALSDYRLNSPSGYRWSLSEYEEQKREALNAINERLSQLRSNPNSENIHKLKTFEEMESSISNNEFKYELSYSWINIKKPRYERERKLLNANKLAYRLCSKAGHGTFISVLDLNLDGIPNPTAIHCE